MITDLHSICNLRITWPIHRFWTSGWPHLWETIAYTAYHHCLMWAYLRRMQGHKPNMGVSVIKVCIYIFHNSTCGDGSLACLDIVSNLPHTFFSPCFTTGKARLSHCPICLHSQEEGKARIKGKKICLYKMFFYKKSYCATTLHSMGHNQVPCILLAAK